MHNKAIFPLNVVPSPLDMPRVCTPKFHDRRRCCCCFFFLVDSSFFSHPSLSLSLSLYLYTVGIFILFDFSARGELIFLFFFLSFLSPWRTESLLRILIYFAEILFHGDTDDKLLPGFSDYFIVIEIPIIEISLLCTKLLETRKKRSSKKFLPQKTNGCTCSTS